MMHLQALNFQKWEPPKAAGEDTVSKVEVLPRKNCGDSQDKRALLINGECWVNRAA